MKVLLIEDTVTSATIVSAQLAKLGLQTVHARSGEAGLEMFKQSRPDLILLDVIMPGLDGFEVARRIRQLEKDGDWTPIIFLTARTSDKDLEYGIEVGGDDYLVKPVSEIVLAAKVRAMQRLAQMRLSLLVLTRRLDDANRELRRLTSVDGLTGIANRRCFDESIAREWQRARRNRLPLSVLMLDVDFFKQYNDRYGHQAGDECLKAVAKCLESELKRPADLVARFGGEEFVVMLPETNSVGARRVAEAMRHALASLELPHESSQVADYVTLSAGVATVYPAPEDTGSVASMMEAADRALYQAKKSGRNRVALADQPEGAAIE
ncbi:GGDEF domain-containing response regulator [Denitromonas iodatirespirans]|uniref:diguanylate cyclase n=1 Tax=Denitromonas iodatirespirans TaxID=2795389 RepID=A0A944DCB8_DENI1|nr:diguanylate cyclase [Denitromonas iodatirespirans]MBT0960123.1 diguanylate cyclase [Denitromonas iodatirespirans]